MGDPKSPAQNLLKVNLLIHKGDQSQMAAKLLKWILSSGRFIVIFVELIVISAFIYRYKLDTDLADIQEKINNQIPYLESMADAERQIRQTHFQLQTISQLKRENPHYTEAINKIAKNIPKNTQLNNLNLELVSPSPKVKFIISGQAPANTNGLSAFIKALKKDPSFSEVNLTNIAFENNIKFTITGTLPRGGID